MTAPTKGTQMEHRTRRILVLSEAARPTEALLEAVRDRAASLDVQFRIVVLNPARAELHLLHPERHDKAAAAEQVLHAALPLLEEAAGGPVVGSVSVRNDPMDAIEETIFSEPVDEIMLAVEQHAYAAWFHQDLPRRLHHFGLPVSVVASASTPGAVT